MHNDNIAISPKISLVRNANAFKYYICLDLSSFFPICKLDAPLSDKLAFLSSSHSQFCKIKIAPFGLNSVVTNAMKHFENKLNKLRDRNE